MRAILLASAVWATQAGADTDRFVESNLLSILYHELGHAIIDTMNLPVFGQEEDAADVASILLIDTLFEEEAAVAIAYDAAFGFLGEAEATEGEEPAYWAVHGHDLQRYYNLVCLFVGADYDGRSDIAEELGLPEARLETCEEEHEIAMDSWGPVFDELAEDAPSQTLTYVGGTDTITEKVVSEEVAGLNELFAFPVDLSFHVEECGDANAFYDPNEYKIVMCTEFADWLAQIAPQ